MLEALVITPVKDSIETTMETIKSVYNSDINAKYIIYNDFSTEETTSILTEHQATYNFELVNLKDVTNTPSPNYRLVLNIARKKAIELNLPLIIIESDVEVQKKTLSKLVALQNELSHSGMIGSVTTNISGEINFPYLNFRTAKKDIVNTNRSLSFCCTLLSLSLLKNSILLNFQIKNTGTMFLFPGGQNNLGSTTTWQ